MLNMKIASIRRAFDAWTKFTGRVSLALRPGSRPAVIPSGMPCPTVIAPINIEIAKPIRRQPDFQAIQEIVKRQKQLARRENTANAWCQTIRYQLREAATATFNKDQASFAGCLDQIAKSFSRLASLTQNPDDHIKSAHYHSRCARTYPPLAAEQYELAANSRQLAILILERDPKLTAECLEQMRQMAEEYELAGDSSWLSGSTKQAAYSWSRSAKAYWILYRRTLDLKYLVSYLKPRRRSAEIFAKEGDDLEAAFNYFFLAKNYIFLFRKARTNARPGYLADAIDCQIKYIEILERSTPLKYFKIGAAWLTLAKYYRVRIGRNADPVSADTNQCRLADDLIQARQAAERAVKTAWALNNVAPSKQEDFIRQALLMEIDCLSDAADLVYRRRNPKASALYAEIQAKIESFIEQAGSRKWPAETVRHRYLSLARIFYNWGILDKDQARLAGAVNFCLNFLSPVLTPRNEDKQWKKEEKRDLFEAFSCAVQSQLMIGRISLAGGRIDQALSAARRAESLASQLEKFFYNDQERKSQTAYIKEQIAARIAFLKQLRRS